MKGFTLIELMIVVAIVMILAAVAIPACTSQTNLQQQTEQLSEKIEQAATTVKIEG